MWSSLPPKPTYERIHSWNLSCGGFSLKLIWLRFRQDFSQVEARLKSMSTWHPEVTGIPSPVGIFAWILLESPTFRCRSCGIFFVTSDVIVPGWLEGKAHRCWCHLGWLYLNASLEGLTMWNYWDDPHWNIYMRKSKRRGHDVKAFFHQAGPEKYNFLWRILRTETTKVAFSSTFVLGKFVETRDGQNCAEGFFEVTQETSRIWSYNKLYTTWKVPGPSSLGAKWFRLTGVNSPSLRFSDGIWRNATPISLGLSWPLTKPRILSMLGFDKLDFLVSFYVFMIWTNARSTWVPSRKWTNVPKKEPFQKERHYLDLFGPTNWFSDDMLVFRGVPGPLKELLWQKGW